MELSLNHISIPVANLEKAVNFYVQYFGFGILDLSDRPQVFSEQVTGIPGMILKIAYISTSNITLELIEYSGTHDQHETIFSNKNSMNHFCLNIDNLLIFYEKNKTALNFISAPLEIPFGVNKDGFMAYLQDNDYNKIELIQKPVKTH